VRLEPFEKKSGDLDVTSRKRSTTPRSPRESRAGAAVCLRAGSSPRASSQAARKKGEGGHEIGVEIPFQIARLPARM